MGLCIRTARSIIFFLSKTVFERGFLSSQSDESHNFHSTRRPSQAGRGNARNDYALGFNRWFLLVTQAGAFEVTAGCRGRVLTKGASHFGSEVCSFSEFCDLSQNLIRR